MTAYYFKAEFAIDSQLSPCIHDDELAELLAEGDMLLAGYFNPDLDQCWYDENKDNLEW